MCENEKDKSDKTELYRQIQDLNRQLREAKKEAIESSEKVRVRCVFKCLVARRYQNRVLLKVK